MPRMRKDISFTSKPFDYKNRTKSRLPGLSFTNRTVNSSISVVWM